MRCKVTTLVMAALGAAGVLFGQACDGTLSGLHRTRGEVPELSPEPVASTEKRASNEPLSIRAQHLLVMHSQSKSAPPTMVRTRAEARARAEEALGKIKGGADFDEVVKAYSDEPGAGARGGDLGKFTRQKMVKKFADAAFKLKVGEVSDVVESEFGFHVIRRTE